MLHIGDDRNGFHELRFGKALAEYLRRTDTGELVKRELFIAEHVEVASELREYFEAADEVALLAGDEVAAAAAEDHGFPRRFGDFELLNEIARGGRGVVFRAIQLSLNRLVAVKMILQGQLAASPDVQRFWSEARAVASLQHPNIVAVYDVGEHEGQHYFSMELVNGRSLEDLVRDHPLSGQKAATYVATIARAIQYAHEQGLLHRDLKPSNVIVDTSDQVKVTDFGFAKRLETAAQQTITGQVLGTPSYMPPEQAIGDHSLLGPACDVYAMGAVLYELLTGRPPFRAESTLETLRQVIEMEAPRPRSLNPSVPRDLETITLKCLAKEPTRRYKSASDLAEDLSRFLHDQPILARPPSVSVRMWRWSRRNRGWTAAILFAVAALMAAATGGVLVSNAVSVSSGRESLLQIQSVERISGWSDRMWGVVAKASQVGSDRTLQGYAALALSGVDARMIRQFRGFGADQVVWDKVGNRLLLSTIANANPRVRGVQVWDKPSGNLTMLASQGLGPIGFSRVGQPVQINVEEDGSALIVRELVDGTVLQRFTAPDGWTIAASPQPVLTTGGSYVAARIKNGSGKPGWAIWHTTNSDPPKVIDPQVNGSVTCSALADDGTLLAVGSDRGVVTVISVSEKKQSARLRVGRHRINCLTFARDRQRFVEPATTPVPVTGWILATGDAGGHIAVWDLETQAPRAFYHGSLFDVYQVEFSPDGMTLASSGRGHSRLWDLATGKQLLEISSNDNASALAFAPDGNTLAIGSEQAFAEGDVSVWKLTFDRGIHTLRGLAGPVSKLNFSLDGSTIAAMAHDWRVGIWDLTKNHLRGAFEMPPGRSADNAAIALNKDGSKLAFCSGTKALLIDSTDGTITNRWDLPDGFVDLFAFVAPDQLISIRYERPEQVRTMRIRNLLGSTGVNPIADITDFSRYVYIADVSSTGEFLIVDGIGGPSGDVRMVRVYNMAGQLVASLPTKATTAYGSIAFDETGKHAAVLVATPPSDGNTKVFDIPSGGVTQSLAVTPLCLASASHVLAVGGGSMLESHGLTLYQTASSTPLVTFDVDALAPAVASFGAGGSLLAWGRSDGTVCIADLNEAKRRLSEVGLAW